MQCVPALFSLSPPLHLLSPSPVLSGFFICDNGQVLALSPSPSGSSLPTESGTELLRMHVRFSIFSAFSAAISARILVTMATLRLYQVAMGAGSWPAAACHVPCQACQPVARLILGTLIDSPSRAGPFFVDGIGGRRGLGARNAKSTRLWPQGGMNGGQLR